VQRSVTRPDKVVRYDRVGRSLIGKRSGKLFEQESVNPIRYVSGHDPGSGSGKASGNMPRYNSGKVLGSNSDKDLGKHSDENSGKVIRSGMNV
jgi:hypothetical protein